MNKFYIFLGSKFGNIAWNKKNFKVEVETFFSKDSVRIKHIDIRHTHGNRYHAFVTLLFLSNEKMKAFNSLIRCASTKYTVINETWKIYQYISKSERLNTAFCEDNDEEVVIDSGENVFEDEATATAELSDKATAEATDKATDKATAEATDKATAEATDKATAELSENVATAELSENATAEALETAEATTYEVTTYENDEQSNDTEISFIDPVYEYEYNEYESIYTWLVTPQLHELKKAEEMKELCRWLATSFWERT
jgi:hypothetical protein